MFAIGKNILFFFARKENIFTFAVAKVGEYSDWDQSQQ